jgi:hypothetical protein
MGGALGLAALASLAAARTNSLSAGGESKAAALLGGYHVAFLVGAIFATVAAGLAVSALRAGAPERTDEDVGATAEPAPCTALSVRDPRSSAQTA